jgi:hypothetical protein
VLKRREETAPAETNGSVEPFFSRATDILQAKRSRTKADLFQMLMIIKRNACID